VGDVCDQGFDFVLFPLKLLGGDGVGGQIVGKPGLDGGEQAFIELMSVE